MFDFSKAYRVEGYGGVAWRVTAHAKESHLVHDYYEDDDGSAGYAEWEDVVDESRVVAHMVGDDRDFEFGIDELTPLEDNEFCRDCGQIGCGHNVYE
jgi:hypothetical protein